MGVTDSLIQRLTWGIPAPVDSETLSHYDDIYDERALQDLQMEDDPNDPNGGKFVAYIKGTSLISYGEFNDSEEISYSMATDALVRHSYLIWRAFTSRHEDDQPWNGHITLGEFVEVIRRWPRAFQPIKNQEQYFDTPAVFSSRLALYRPLVPKHHAMMWTMLVGYSGLAFHKGPEMVKRCMDRGYSFEQVAEHFKRGMSSPDVLSIVVDNGIDAELMGEVFAV